MTRPDLSKARSPGRERRQRKMKKPPDPRRSGGLPGISQYHRDRNAPSPGDVSLRYRCARAYYKCRSCARNTAHVALATREGMSGPGFLRAPEPPTWVVQVFLRPGLLGGLEPKAQRRLFIRQSVPHHGMNWPRFRDAQGSGCPRAACRDRKFDPAQRFQAGFAIKSHQCAGQGPGNGRADR